MPDIVLHNEMGNRVLERLDKEITNNINVQMMHFGLMAPDIYMSYRFFFPHFRHGINRRGVIMHEEKCTEFLVELIQNCKDQDSFSLVCGIICHFSLDSSVHPLVNQIGKGKPGMHGAIEHALDMMELRKQQFTRGDVIKYFTPYCKSPLLIATMKKIYGWEDSDYYYKVAYNHLKLYYRFCCDRYGVINKVFGRYTGKLSYLSYASDKCSTINLEPFSYLIIESINLAVDIINAAYSIYKGITDETTLIQIISNRTYLGQISGMQEQQS